MNGQGDFAATLTGWAHQAGEIALGWLSSPAAWSQFGLLAVAYLVARLATARATPFVTRLLDPAAKPGPLANARRFALRFVPLMLPLVAYGLTAMGEEVTRELERRVILSVLDRKWREHLYEMDYLRDGIGLRAMAQRDPLIEYQREGYDLFTAMMDSIKEETVGYLFNVEVQVQQAPVVQPAELTYSAPNEDGAAETHQERTAPSAGSQKPQDGEKGSSFFKN